MGFPTAKSTAIKSVTILDGASQSDVIDLEGYSFVAIEMPAVWTTANITVLAASKPGGTFVPVHDDAGAEVTITAAAARVISIASVEESGGIAPLRFIKLRSGTTATPVNQADDRVLTLILKAR